MHNDIIHSPKTYCVVHKNNFFFIAYGVILYCLCGCFEPKSEPHSLDRNTFETYRQESISLMDNKLTSSSKSACFEKIPRRRFVKPMSSINVRDDFVFFCDGIVLIDSKGKDQVISVYAVSYGMDFTTGIKQSYVSPAFAFKIRALDNGKGKTKIDYFKLISSPDLPLVCKTCVRGLNRFVQHNPTPPKYFSLVKINSVKINNHENQLNVQCSFLFQVYKRGDGCLRQSINRTVMIPGTQTNEFEFVTQQEYCGAYLKLLTSNKTAFEIKIPFDADKV